MQIAIVIDIAFVVAVFLFLSFVPPDLHIESGRSLLEFRDPLSLLPETKNIGADEAGGGIEFMRPWTERVYGIPPEQVVGSSIKTKYELRNGVPELIRLPEINLIDDKAGKPVGINSHIGRRPIAAFGNSDGDFEMLEWTTAGSGARLGVLVHHDDAAREYAYDRKSNFGRLDRGLDEAPKRGWTLISMKDDWKRIFKFQ